MDILAPLVLLTPLAGFLVNALFGLAIVLGCRIIAQMVQSAIGAA